MQARDQFRVEGSEVLVAQALRLPLGGELPSTVREHAQVRPGAVRPVAPPPPRAVHEARRHRERHRDHAEGDRGHGASSSNRATRSRSCSVKDAARRRSPARTSTATPTPANASGANHKAQVPGPSGGSYSTKSP